MSSAFVEGLISDFLIACKAAKFIAEHLAETFEFPVFLLKPLDIVNSRDIFYECINKNFSP